MWQTCIWKILLSIQIHFCHILFHSLLKCLYSASSSPSCSSSRSFALLFPSPVTGEQIVQWNIKVILKFEYIPTFWPLYLIQTSSHQCLLVDLIRAFQQHCLLHLLRNKGINVEMFWWRKRKSCYVWHSTLIHLLAPCFGLPSSSVLWWLNSVWKKRRFWLSNK